MRTKLFYYYFCLLVLSSVIIRYPNSPHASGNTDSFDNFSEAVLLSDLGYHFYFFNFLSFIGAYPLSRNMGGSTFLSSFSLLTGLDIEISILFISIAFGIIGSLNYSILYRYFDRDKLIFLICFTIISFSPLFLTYTNWNYSYRVGTFILYPLVYFSFFKLLESYRTNFTSNLLLFSLLFFTAISFHRISVFLLHFLFGILFSQLLLRVFKIRDKGNMKFFQSVYFTLLISSLYIYSIFGSFYEADKDVEIFSFNEIFEILSYFLSFTRNYTKFLGLLSLFLPFGLFFAVKRLINFKQNKFVYPLVIILFYIPFIHDIQYAGNYIFCFLALLITFGISSFLKKFKIGKKMPSFSVIFIILILCLVPQFVVVDSDPSNYTHNSTDEPIFNSYVYPEDYNLALYSKYQTTDSVRFLFNSGGIEDEVSSYSGKIVYGIPATYDENRLKSIGLVDLATGNYDHILRSDVQIESLTNLYWDVYRTEERNWNDDRTQSYLDFYTFGSGKYLIVQPNFANATHVSSNSGNSYESLFFTSVEKDLYVVYSDEMYNVRSLNYD